MPNLHIGECVTFRDRVYLVRGVTPMSTAPRRVQLENVDTREQFEAVAEHVVRAKPMERDERPKTRLRSVS